jgi:hypothetical protein
MSSLDPFGSSSMRTFAPRKAQSDFGGPPGKVVHQANAVLRDAYSQVTRGKTHVWARASSLLALVNLSAGGLTIAWALVALFGHVFMVHAIGLGALELAFYSLSPRRRHVARRHLCRVQRGIATYPGAY